MTEQQLLDHIGDLFMQEEYLKSEKTKLLDQVIPPQIRAEINDIEAEFESKQAAVETQIAEAKKLLSPLVAIVGHSMKGKGARAVLTPAKDEWNDKILEKLALIWPEINNARIPGKPVVRISRVAG